MVEFTDQANVEEWCDNQPDKRAFLFATYGALINIQSVTDTSDWASFEPTVLSTSEH